MLALQAVLLLVAATPVATARPAPPPAKPNILMIVLDDLGWGDVGYHGGSIRTPNLDRLAKEGVRLERHYVHPVCSPTRAALLGGRYPSRFGATKPTNERVFAPDTVTLPAALRSVGYATAISGKWHLGSTPAGGPLQHGFDRSYGLFAGGIDQYLHLYKNGPFQKTWHRDDRLIEEKGHSTDLIAAQAVRWLGEKRKQPFFLHVAFTAVHIPIQEPAAWTKRYKGRPDQLYAGCLEHVDDAIGKILAAVDRSGKRKDTLVVLTSDNGSPEGNQTEGTDAGGYPGRYPLTRLGDNGPLHGAKGTVYEGGIRVPALARWSGVLKPGALEAPINAVDWMPTLTRLAGYTPPRDLSADQSPDQSSDESWDGQDIWPLLTGAQAATPRRMYWKMSDTQYAVRDGDWKLIVVDDKTELYDLGRDPYEKADLAAGEPKRVADLRAFLAQQQALDRASLASLGRPKGLQGVPSTPPPKQP